jgi:hypothetical protein
LGEGLNLTAAIDAGSPSPIIKTNQLLAGQTIVNQQLFAASGLAPGNHVVVITSQDSHLLAIDYFLFEADSSTNTSPFVGGTSSSAPPLPTLNATNPAPPSSQRLQTGLIAAAIGGGAVGGGAVVALLIGLFIWRRKRRRNDSIEHGKHIHLVLRTSNPSVLGSIPPSSSRTFAWTDQGNSDGPPLPANQMNFREVHHVDVSNPLAVRPFLQWVAETQPPPPKYHPT